MVAKFKETLDALLKFNRARTAGLCPARRALYDEVFDELIRQVTIACSERGAMLLRVRDELRMSIDSYRALYESSVAFAIRKCVASEEGKEAREQQVCWREP